MNKIFPYLIILVLSGSLSYGQGSQNGQEAVKSEVVPGSADSWFGYKPSPFRIKSYHRPAGDMRYKSAQALPAKYDLREEGLVTGARNQNPGGGPSPAGNCTSFASIGSIESRWMEMGFAATDLSEQNLAACNGFDEENWGYGQGANQYVCSAYLTRFDGPVSEADDPYDTESPSCVGGLFPVALVPESRWLPVRDFELLRNTVYNYGAVYVGIYWDVTGSSFSSSDNTYYYNGSASANHAVLVCGWDDDIVTAGGTGAWIVKNSWGTGWADNGFFYISYQDAQFAADEMAYFPVRWENNDVDTVFMHDELGFTGTINAPNTNEFFELARFDAPEEYLITNVGIAVPEAETVLDFWIYDDFDGENLSNLIAASEGNYVELQGIYTFPIIATVNGDFYVQARRKRGDNEINYAVESADPGFSDPVYNEDVNWFKREETGSWRATFFEALDEGFNLTIRAFGKKTDAPRAVFTSNKTQACIQSDVIYTYLENNEATTFLWDFGEGAVPATASTPGPHTVQYTTTGTKDVSLFVSGPAGSDTLVRHDLVNVDLAIRVNVPEKSIDFPFGESREITAFGADEYSWSPSNILDNGSGQTVTATPPEIGSYELIVTGRQGLCADADTLTVSATFKPPNDDMCDAMLIAPGGRIGVFSNENASPEPDEPSPEEGSQPGDCLKPLKWCYEDGVQVNNSLWFYFYGPETGLASLRTYGMDNQMAVYRADTCINIIVDSLKAANDDYNETVPDGLAATIDGVEVIPGEKYYVQIDGSFGGAKGEFEFYFYAYWTGREEIPAPGKGDDGLSVYPNPAGDVINVHLRRAGSPEVEVLLYNLNGRMIIRKSFSGMKGEVLTRLDISRQPAGVYHLRVMDGKRILDRKLIKQ